MIRAYDKIYLEDAMGNLAVALDYGAVACVGGIAEFYDRMLVGDVIPHFERAIRNISSVCPALTWPKGLSKVQAAVSKNSTMSWTTVLLSSGPAGYLHIFNGILVCRLCQ